MLKNLFSWWFFPIHSNLGVFPVKLTENGSQFIARKIIVPVVVLFLSCLNTYLQGRNGDVLKLSSTEKIERAINETVTWTGSLIITIFTSAKFMGKRFNRIISSIASTEDLLNGQMKGRMKGKQVFDKLIIATNVYMAGMFLLSCHYSIKSTGTVNIGLVFSYYNQWVIMSIALIFMKFVLLQSRGFIGINKLVRHCRCGPFGSIKSPFGKNKNRLLDQAWCYLECSFKLTYRHIIIILF